MIEPVYEKEARSDHHNRQTLRKPADRSKKFNQKNATKPKSPQSVSSGAGQGSFNRTHGKAVDFIRKPPVRSNSEDFHDEDGDDTETEDRERAIMIMQGAKDGTGAIVKGVDGIVLEETREAASLVPIEDLIASAYAKKPRKSKADRYDHIRGLGKQHVSLAPKSVTAVSSKAPHLPKFPHEHDDDSDWESIGEDGTEAWEYNSEWRAEMSDIAGETLAQKTSYRDALATAAVISLDSNSVLGSETSEARTESTDGLP